VSDSAPTGGPFLVFEIGEIGRPDTSADESSPDAFAIDVAHVLNVLEAEHVVQVPLSPAVVEGVLNHHGRIVTVIDPAPLLELAPQPDPVAHVVILRRPGGIGGHIGLKVVRTQEIVAAARLEEMALQGGACVDRVVRRERHLIHIVSYDALLSELSDQFAYQERADQPSTGPQGVSP